MVAEEAARFAVTAFVRRSLVLIVFTRQGTRSTAHASGTLIAGSDGRLGVLTAKHCINPGELITLASNEGLVEDCVEEVHHHDKVDIAVAILRPKVATIWAHLALRLSQVEIQPERRLSPGHLLVMGGFPNQFRRDVVLSHNARIDRFVPIVQFTSDYGHDSRSISIRWKHGVISGSEFPFDDLGVPRRTQIPLRKPTGMSGGPLFRVTPTRRGTLWSPESDMHLIGVAYAFSAHREQAVPWWHWSSWLHSRLHPAHTSRERGPHEEP